MSENIESLRPGSQTEVPSKINFHDVFSIPEHADDGNTNEPQRQHGKVNPLEFYENIVRKSMQHTDNSEAYKLNVLSDNDKRTVFENVLGTLDKIKDARLAYIAVDDKHLHFYIKGIQDRNPFTVDVPYSPSSDAGLLWKVPNDAQAQKLKQESIKDIMSWKIGDAAYENGREKDMQNWPPARVALFDALIKEDGIALRRTINTIAKTSNDPEELSKQLHEIEEYTANERHSPGFVKVMWNEDHTHLKIVRHNVPLFDCDLPAKSQND